MLGALILATGATLAPPFLVGKAVSAALDGDTTALELIVAAFLGAALVGWGTSYLQTYLVGWVGERALQDLRIRIFTHLQQMSIGFFTRNRPGVLISRITNDVDALDQLISTRRGHALLQHPDPRRGRRDHAGGRRPAGAGRVPDAAAAGDREPGLPDRRGERLPDHARADRGGDGLPAGEPQRRAGRPELRAGAAPRRADGRAQRAQPPGQPEDGLPERVVLPGGRAALGDRDGGDPALRRLPGARSGDRVRAERADRDRGRVRRLPLHLLRPDPAALQPLHDLPAGDGGAGQDLRPARHGAGHGRQAGRARPRDAARRDRDGSTSGSRTGWTRQLG